MTNRSLNVDESPFHAGEQRLQELVGVREKMERFGRQVIRDYMPDQHREFYNQLPFVLVGHADHNGWPWASIVHNPPGFITSPSETRLKIAAQSVAGDPLGDTLRDHGADTRLGLLGIELTTRRRNRLSGRVSEVSAEGLVLDIDQAFGNCPQYIQTRELETVDPQDMPPASVTDITRFDAEAMELIRGSDTFFVASYVANNAGAATDGVDVSHRGGKPGFVRVDDEYSLTIPDYLGNFHFNTLGNFLENPRAGLLFVDFEHGHLLTLTGTVEVLLDSPDTHHFAGAERLWTFRIDHGRWLRNSLPLRWKLAEFSPNSLLTGSWDEAAAAALAEADRERWVDYEVVRVIDESSVIKSFCLRAPDDYKPAFEPGQFLTVKAVVAGEELIRTYTVSSAPGDDTLRISVKREGTFSRYLHESLAAGDMLAAKAPRGLFTFDASEQRPAVLISAGVGITPMVSMARHAVYEGVRTRYMRSLTLISAARNGEQRAFFAELNEIARRSSGKLRSFWILSKPGEEMQPGVDFHQQGRLSRELLQALLPIDDYDFYLCGPDGFMQSTYSMLRELGVRDARIYAEAFGPAALMREPDEGGANVAAALIAEEAVVQFSESGVEQAWSKVDGTLLEFAEAHGLTPAYGCRSGQCGSCKVKLVSGTVTYPRLIASDIAEDEVLTCCAMPAASEDGEMTRIEIAL